MISKSEYDRNIEKLDVVDRNHILAQLTDTIRTQHFCLKFKKYSKLQCLYAYDGTRVGASFMKTIMCRDADMLHAENMSTVMLVMDYIVSMFDVLDIGWYDGIVMYRNEMPTVLAVKSTELESVSAIAHPAGDVLAKKTGKLLRFDIEHVHRRVNEILEVGRRLKESNVSIRENLPKMRILLPKMLLLFAFVLLTVILIIIKPYF